MSKIFEIWKALHAGYELQGAAAWKNRTNALSAMIVVLTALVKVSGYESSIGADDIESIALGIVVAVNVVMSVLTSKKIGMQSSSGETDS